MADLEVASRIRLLDATFNSITRAQAASLVDEWVAKRDRPRIVTVRDAALTMRTRDEPALASFYEGVDLVLVDGRGLYYASKMLGSPLPEMVGGPGLYYELLRRSDRNGYKAFLLGARQPVVDAAAANIRARHPGVKLVGVENGYYKDDEIPAILGRIKSALPDLVFVGTTTPRREVLLAAIRDAKIPCVAMGIGGLFDVEAGMARHAPEWIARSGFEWLYRGLQEPTRLLPRYFSTHPRFVLLLLRELVLGARGR